MHTNAKSEVQSVARQFLDVDLAQRSPLAPVELTTPMIERALLEVWRRAVNHGYNFGYEQGGTEMRDTLGSRIPREEF
jgi:hypothetical protein